MPADAHIDPHIGAFLARWAGASGGELANYQLFLTERAELFELPRPDPAAADRDANAYVFERQVTFRFGDGGSGDGRIDLYRRGAFVCEAKKVRADTAPVSGRKSGKRRAAASTAAADTDAPGPVDPGAPRERIAWPKTAPEQARAVAEVLARARGPLGLDAIAAHFTGRGRWRDRLPELLDTLTALGRAHRSADTWRGG